MRLLSLYDSHRLRTKRLQSNRVKEFSICEQIAQRSGYLRGSSWTDVHSSIRWSAELPPLWLCALGRFGCTASRLSCAFYPLRSLRESTSNEQWPVSSIDARKFSIENFWIPAWSLPKWSVPKLPALNRSTDPRRSSGTEVWVMNSSNV